MLGILGCDEDPRPVLESTSVNKWGPSHSLGQFFSSVKWGWCPDSLQNDCLRLLYDSALKSIKRKNTKTRIGKLWPMACFCK